MAKGIQTIKNQFQIIQNETIEDANTANRVGGAGYDLADFVEGLAIGQTRKEGVDTYNDISDGKTSLLNSYPTPEKGWTVLVRNDETNGGKATLYQWNGTNWINLETVVYNDDVVSGSSLQVQNSPFDIIEVNDLVKYIKSITIIGFDKTKEWRVFSFGYHYSSSPNGLTISIADADGNNTSFNTNTYTVNGNALKLVSNRGTQAVIISLWQNNIVPNIQMVNTPMSNGKLRKSCLSQNSLLDVDYIFTDRNKYNEADSELFFVTKTPFDKLIEYSDDGSAGHVRANNYLAEGALGINYKSRVGTLEAVKLNIETKTVTLLKSVTNTADDEGLTKTLMFDNEVLLKPNERIGLRGAIYFSFNKDIDYRPYAYTFNNTSQTVVLTKNLIIGYNLITRESNLTKRSDVFESKPYNIEQYKSNSNVFADRITAAWAFGINPEYATKISKIIVPLSVLTENQRVELRIYSRPVNQIGSTLYPGYYSGDVLLDSVNHVFPLSGLKNIEFTFTEISATAGFIYLFEIAARNTDNSYGAIGIGCNNDSLNIGKNIFVHGYYMETTGARSYITTTQPFVLARTIVGFGQVNRIDVLNKHLTETDATLANLTQEVRNTGTRSLYSKNLLPNVTSDFIIGGAIGSFSNDGLTINVPHANNLNNIAILNRYYSLEKRTMRALMKLGSDSSVVIACWRSSTEWNSRFIIDAVTKKLIIFRTIGNASVDIPFFDHTHPYIVEVTKDFQTHIFTITDAFTSDTATITDLNEGTGDFENQSGSGYQHDYYGFALNSGSPFIVQRMEVIADRKNVDMLIYGDSITEMSYYPNVDNENRWTQLILNKMGGNVLFSGRGGAVISHIINRIKNELPYIKAKYVMVTIGTNGGNTLDNLRQLMDYIISCGSIPILNHIPCNESGTQVTVNAMIDQIRAEYKIKGANFDIPTSIAFDGVEVNKNTMYHEHYDWGDIWHHPNVEGSLRMFTQTLIDLSEIYK